MAENNDLMTGYVMGQTENRGNGGLFGGDGIVGLIAILALLGGGMGGFGFGGGGMLWPLMMMGGFGGFGGWGGGNAALQGMATRADINEGFALNGITNGISAIRDGVSNGFHGVDNAICSLGYNVQAGFNGIQHSIDSCCCATQRAIDGVNYNLATGLCNIQQSINGSTRDLMENQNNNTRAILDFLTNDKISTLQAENQTLKFAASQSNQNAVLMAAMDANKAEILRRSGFECPVPAFVVQPPTPVRFNQGCGCGCGNGYGYAAA